MCVFCKEVGVLPVVASENYRYFTEFIFRENARHVRGHVPKFAEVRGYFGTKILQNALFLPV